MIVEKLAEIDVLEWPFPVHLFLGFFGMWFVTIFFSIMTFDSFWYYFIICSWKLNSWAFLLCIMCVFDMRLICFTPTSEMHCENWLWNSVFTLLGRLWAKNSFLFTPCRTACDSNWIIKIKLSRVETIRADSFVRMESCLHMQCAHNLKKETEKIWKEKKSFGGSVWMCVISDVTVCKCVVFNIRNYCWTAIMKMNETWGQLFNALCLAQKFNFSLFVDTFFSRSIDSFIFFSWYFNIN